MNFNQPVGLPFRKINVLIVCVQLMPITMSIIELHNETYKKPRFLFPCCGLLYFFASLFVSVRIYLSGFYHVTIFRKWDSDHLPVFRFLHIFAIWILSHFRVVFVLICFVCGANCAEAHNVLKYYRLNVEELYSNVISVDMRSLQNTKDF